MNEARRYKTRQWLVWESANCATDYVVIVRMDSKAGQLVERVQTQDTRIRTKSLQREHTYFWRVKACNEFGCRRSRFAEFTILPARTN